MLGENPEGEPKGLVPEYTPPPPPLPRTEPARGANNVR